MSAPRTKRPFAGVASDPAQRQITSFFSRQQSVPCSDADDRTPSQPGRPSAAAPSSVPTLPPSVQSNLLSVGMRVRKSVPEGYKTGSDCGSFVLWSDEPAKKTPGTHAPPPPPPSSSSSSPQQRHQQQQQQPYHPHLPAPGAVLSSRRELLPFCGIHSVGGLSSQPAFDEAPGEDDNLPPPLTSSQDSVQSTLSATSANSRKRPYLHDSDADGGDGDGGPEAPTLLSPDRVRVWRHQFPDGEVSPRSLAPLGWEGARVMAAPRGRRAGGGGGPLKGGVVAGGTGGQENVGVQVRVLSSAGDDFEEAEFLDYGAWSAMDSEMGGV